MRVKATLHHCLAWFQGGESKLTEADLLKLQVITPAHVLR
jgi:hypothetical protein